jgi:hypothetical protein
MFRRRAALIALPLSLILAFAACGPRLIPSGWVRLGRAEVVFTARRAVIPVPPAAPAVKRLIVVVLLNDVDFLDVRVEFANGTFFERPNRARLSPGRDSIVMDLPGERRKVREVIVQYQNVRQTAVRAGIEVWGDPR